LNIVTACLGATNRKSTARRLKRHAAVDFAVGAAGEARTRRALSLAEARTEWRKYLFMDVHDDRDVMEKVRASRRFQVPGSRRKVQVSGIGFQVGADLRLAPETLKPKTRT